MAMQQPTTEKFGGRFGKRGSQSRETEKLVTFLQLTHTPPEAVPWIENPCVGGSIPPQATIKLSLSISRHIINPVSPSENRVFCCLSGLRPSPCVSRFYR